MLIITESGRVNMITSCCRYDKPPDAGDLKLKKIGLVLLKTGFMRMLLMLMMTNTKENSTKTITLLTVEEIIGGEKEEYMMALMCPTGGRYNILRFAMSVEGTLIQGVQNLWEVDEKSESRGDKRGKMNKTEEKSANNINLWLVGGSYSVGILFRRRKRTNADQRNDRDISWEVTNTSVVPIKNPVMMNVWEDIQQFNFGKTIRMARRIVLYNSLQLVVMNKRLNRGELLVEVQDKFMYAEENTMVDVREPYMVVVSCRTGGHKKP